MTSAVDNEVDAVLAASIDVVLAGVPELHGYKHVVPTIVVPAILAFPPDEFTYGDSFNNQDSTLLYVLRLYVQRTQNGDDQRQLHGYISRDGPTSILAAIEADPRLRGTCADAQVIQAVNVGNWPVGSQTYLGCELRVRVLMN
jgi:hypothetical protein